MQPTIFHVTHYKAGSQWVAEVLKHCAPARFVPPQVYAEHVICSPLEAGSIYPTVYAARPALEAALAAYPVSHRIFVVVRDLRDALVSLYFSMKFSHAILNPAQQHTRDMLRREAMEEGLLLLIGRIMDKPILDKLVLLSRIDKHERIAKPGKRYLSLPLTTATNAHIQQSWNDAPVWHLRYEDLLVDEYGVFEQIIDYCEIDVPRERLYDIIKYNTFEAVTGRQPGEEDPSAHQRKGIAGDWRNYFTDRVKDQFKAMYGDVLIETGYEQDFNW